MWILASKEIEACSLKEAAGRLSGELGSYQIHEIGWNLSGRRVVFLGEDLPERSAVSGYNDIRGLEEL